MAKYVAKRIGLAILTILIISLLTFFAMNAIPGGPFETEKATTEAVRAVLEQRYHLDLPLWQQYLIYMKQFLHGDLGVSIKTGRSISGIIGQRFPVSMRLGGCAVLIALVLGLIFGSIAALNRNKISDRLIVFFSTLATAVPSFILATLLLLIFCIKLNLFSVWSASGNNYFLAVIALCLYPCACITRLTKTSMLDVMNQDYVRTARAKGVTKFKVIFKHTLRNALIPVVTYVGPEIAYIITGSLVVEKVFTIGGLGREFVESISNRDYTMIMGTTMFLAVIMVTANLITDVVYKLIDPRIQYN